MGACSFVNEVIAATAEEGFRKLVENAIDRYGNDHYNGTISTCSMGRCTKIIDGKYTDKNRDEAYLHIKANDNGSKWSAHYVKAGIIGYRITTVEEIVVKHGDAKSIYVIYDENNKKVKSSYDKLKCKSLAMEYAKENPGVSLYIRRETVYSNNENDDLYRYKTTERIVDKPIKGKKNELCVPIYKFYFYGWAAC